MLNAKTKCLGQLELSHNFSESTCETYRQCVVSRNYKNCHISDKYNNNNYILLKINNNAYVKCHNTCNVSKGNKLTALKQCTS